MVPVGAATRGVRQRWRLRRQQGAAVAVILSYPYADNRFPDDLYAYPPSRGP